MEEERSMLLREEEEAASSAPSAAAPLAPRSGSVLVLDKHITFASLHSALPLFLRRDVFPFAVAFAALLLQAAPALLYEAHVAWIQSGEIELPEADAEAAAEPDASAQVSSGAWELSDSGVELANATAGSNGTAPLTQVQLEIAALPVPDSMHFWCMYLLPLFAFLYAILWLALYWNVKLQVAMRYRTHRGAGPEAIQQAECIRVQPVEHGGKSEICALQRGPSTSASGSVSSELFFLFQKTKYIYHQAPAAAPASNEEGEPLAKAWFAPLDFPVGLELSAYLAAGNTGLSVDRSTQLMDKYGENVFDIPLPPFMDLFKEHAMAPFFVFQIFCVLLWCLDEYWYYSLVTLFMLILFECTVVKRRLKSLEFLREMRIKPYLVNVYRAGKWTSVLTSRILPGEVISLVRPANEQNVVPADIVLLTGSVVVNEAMLSGESVPQIKENIEATADNMAVKLDVTAEHKRNILFGGTKILLHNAPGSSNDASSSSSSDSAAVLSALRIKGPPDGGCIGFVLRTGFNTSQGRLVRTILFSSESVSINNTESLLFICVLLVFAVAASAYVCIKGLEDESRSRYKLMLNCIMIITSVVPPELPMELSLAVNTSLLALMKCQIFCTEPFRIPVAGAVDLCAFDKTGTLTADEFIVRGIAGIKPEVPAIKGAAAASSNAPVDAAPSSADAPAELISTATQLPMFVKYVIAGCHSLTYLPDAVATDASSAAGTENMDHLIGDPLEKSSLAFVGWNSRGETSVNRAPGGHKERLRSVHKYPFSSALKRMSCVVALEHEPGTNLRVVTKGAAEILEPMFDPATLPHNYTELHTTYSQQGCRVLALGYKVLDGFRDGMDDRRRLKGLSRAADIESGLTFAGFLVLQCPLKKDSLDVIKQLKQSTHQVMMITGDATLTAASVAAELTITTKLTLILQLNRSAPAGSELYWQRNTVGEAVTLPFSMDYTDATLSQLRRSYDLCVGGDALDFLLHAIQEQHKQQVAAASSPASVTWTVGQRLSLLIKHVSVFARTSPDQKELILHWLKLAGMTTLMCGDGTNDVGALKQAHIGVALIGGDAAKIKPKPKPAAGAPGSKAIANTPQAIREQQLAKIKAAQTAAAAQQIVVPGAAPGDAAAQRKAALQLKLKEQLAALEAEMGQEENTTPRLGDASIASPFTSKLPFITSCVDIIRQGRCTLVTTLQMFNILGINCLISAYSMSVLYLDGIKWGDTQMTISSLSIAMFFLFISRSQPVKVLSAERPHKKLFTPYMMLSVIGQFALHMAVLLTAIAAANPHTPDTPEHKSPEKTFKPNVLNTVVYLVSTTQTVATFAANYRGRPFMEDLTENRALYKSLLYTFLLMLTLASEAVPFLNTFLELHALPSGEFKMQLIALLLFDVASTFYYSKMLKRIFAITPKDANKKSGAAPAVAGGQIMISAQQKKTQ